MVDKRITSKKQGFFLVQKKTDQFIPSFKTPQLFRKNARNAKWVMKNFTDNVESVKYIVSDKHIMVDCDGEKPVAIVENMLQKLGIDTYNYQTSPGHKHFWFSVDNNVREMIDKFKLNSLNHKLYIDGIDTRAFRISNDEFDESGEALDKTGGVFIYDSKKDNSTRPNAQVFIENIFKELPVCPIMLIVPSKSKWTNLGAYPIQYDKVVKSGQSGSVTRHEQELVFTKNFQQAELSENVAHQWWKEIIKFNNDYKRPAPTLQYIKTIYKQKQIKANIVEQITDYNIPKDPETKIPLDLDSAIKLVERRADELKTKIMNKLKWVYYAKDYYVQDIHNIERINFSDHHETISDVKKFFNIESKEVIKYEKNIIIIIGYTPIGVPIEKNAKKIALTKCYDDLKLLKNRITKVEHSVVCSSHYIINNTVFENIGASEPFTINKVDRKYKPNTKCPPLLTKFLNTFFGTPERVEKALDLMSFSIANTPAPCALVITGPPRCGKGTLEKLINGVVGIKNIASLDGDKVVKGEAFALEGIVGKLTALFEEQGGYVVAKVNNLFKKLFDGVETLSGISQKYKKLKINKNTTSYMLFSNDILEFDITDRALMERFALIDIYPYYVKENALTEQEHDSMLDNEATYDWLFKTFFERQVRLLGKFKQRNRDYKFDNEAYIKAIFELTPLLNELTKMHYSGKSVHIAKCVSEILELKSQIPVQVVKRALHYIGYIYEPKTDTWSTNEWAINAM